MTGEPNEIVHRPTRDFIESTNVWDFIQVHDIADYEELIERTTRDIGEESSGVDWFWDEVVNYLDIEFYEDYNTVRNDADGPQFTQWYPGGELNIAHNTLDRHVKGDSSSRNSAACIWEGEEGEIREVTYQDLYRRANQVANALEERDIDSGDTVGLYMPMVPEVLAILYGCFKAGAIAVPIFSGFGVDAIETRIEDAECSVLFTSDGFRRRGSDVILKESADEAIERAGQVEHTIVYNHLGADISRNQTRDEWWADAVETQEDSYSTKSLPSDSESMLLYSSGTTGQPKGIVHTHAGGLIQPAKEVYFGFDLKPSDRFFWVSDIGWMMGPWSMIGTHTFGETLIMYEGAPDYPEPDRFWEMIDRHDITQFGISPTAIRALKKKGNQWLEGHDLSSLRILGSTGEPWDSESWHWFYENIGGGNAPIINISGGTEVFGCFLMPMPIQSLKPCTLGGPGLGMAIDIVNENGESVKDDHERGYLVAIDTCPSMTKSLWSGDNRYIEEYWSRFEEPPMWNHGDWAQVDDDGFWFLHGRADDALNVAGRKVGPAEVEGAAMEHDAVAQAAAVGVPDDVTGSAVVVYAIVEDGHEITDDLETEIRDVVGKEQGKPFRPREVLFVDELPMTQSGKVVRRAVQAAYSGEDFGDLSSIENSESLEQLRDLR